MPPQGRLGMGRLGPIKGIGAGAGTALVGADTSTGVAAIVVASLTNTVVKCGMIVALASPGLRRRSLVATGLLLAGGLAVVAVF